MADTEIQQVSRRPHSFTMRHTGSAKSSWTPDHEPWIRWSRPPVPDARTSRKEAVPQPTSSQTELRLINVARASLEELLLDYEDFLRHLRLTQWTPDCPEAKAVRNIPQRFRKTRPDQADPSDLTCLTDRQRWALYAPWLEHDDPAVRANTLICLINQANYLLDRQIAALEKAFVKAGGYSEQLAAARLAERQRHTSDQSDQTDPTDHIPACPQCGKPMVLRTAQAGKNAGRQFWGCTAYPDCRGVVNV